jgi:hypothetical protein
MITAWELLVAMTKTHAVLGDDAGASRTTWRGASFRSVAE